MDRNLRIAYTEVDKIISHMDNKYIEKIPKKLRTKISEQSLDDYHFEIDPAIDLKDQNISAKALAILAVINYRYWCEDDEIRRKLLAQYQENERKFQEKIRQKYNPDNIFKKTKNENIDVKKQKCVEMVEYKEKKTIISKIVDKIKDIFGLT